jgi:hypothetical protein
MKRVEYKYDIDQKVKTPFGEEGIVSMLGFDEAGNQYHVKTANDSQWFKEKQLTETD